MADRISIVLADDHKLVRQGLRALLELEPDLDVVGEVSDGLQVGPVVERLLPDVLVVDLVMPGLGGLEAARQVSRISPRTKTVILSMHNAEGYVMDALKSGASAYVFKDASSTELVLAIREAAAGRRYMSSILPEGAVEAYWQKAEAGATDAHDTLTAREREVLHLAVRGLTSSQIAQRLCISPRTAETHRSHIMHKLGLKGQTDLVRYAVRRGILPP